MDLSLIVVTDRRLAGRPLLDVIAAALDGGARTVWLREKDLPVEHRRELAEQIRALGADVIAGGPDALGGKAIHLGESDPPAEAELIGRSCHSAAQMAALTVEHYCTLSPIFESVSKPGYGPALGVGMLRKGVVALGGVDTPQRAYACREAGATGVAVMGAVMRAEDPARVVKGLLA